MWSRLLQRYRESLRLKLALPALAVVVTMVAGFSFGAVTLLRRGMVQTEQEAAFRQAALLVHDKGLILDLLEEDRVGLRTYLARELETSMASVGCAVYRVDPAGTSARRLAAFSRGDIAPSELFPESLAEPAFSIEEDREAGNGRNLLIVTAPIWFPKIQVSPLEELAAPDLPVGILRVAWSLDAAARRANAYYLWITGISVAVVLLGAFAISRVINTVLLPISALLAGMERVMTGHLDHRIFTSYDDEIGLITKRFNDMAERLEQSQQQIQQNARNLEIKVRERTRELRAAYEELKTLDAAKDRFLSSISHEMRTPLTSILAAVEILCDYADNDPKARQEFLAMISEEANRMLSLVGDVLDLAKVEAHTLELDLQEIDLRGLVKGVLARLRRNAAEAEVRLDYDNPTAKVTLRCDPRRIERIVRSLVENAIQHSPAGGRVVLELASDEQRVLLHVRDEGPGLPADVLEQVLGASLQQATLARQSSHRGLGMSLPLSVAFARMHGGDLRYEPRPGGGAEFVLELPVGGPGPGQMAGAAEPGAAAD